MAKEVPHGTIRRYWRGCRCQVCKDANNTYQHNRYHAKKAEALAFQNDTKPIETQKYQGLVEEALEAFRLDPAYVIKMAQAAASDSSSPQAQYRRP